MKLPNTISKDMESGRWILSMFSPCVMCKVGDNHVLVKMAIL